MTLRAERLSLHVIILTEHFFVSVGFSIDQIVFMPKKDAIEEYSEGFLLFIFKLKLAAQFHFFFIKDHEFYGFIDNCTETNKDC